MPEAGGHDKRASHGRNLEGLVSQVPSLPALAPRPRGSQEEVEWGIATRSPIPNAVPCDRVALAFSAVIALITVKLRLR